MNSADALEVGRVVEVPVRAGEGRLDYRVLVGSGLLERLPALIRKHAPAHRYALVADSNVGVLYGRRALQEMVEAGLACELLTFPAGEESKSRTMWSELTDAMLGAGVGRDGAVLALGGGVTGDLAGFVAATYLRGVPVVQLPTSLVAMMDSAVGGKTGVDVPAGKNLVGAFHPPRLVVVDPRTVATLPRTERAQGLVEAIKHGAIMDVHYLSRLERDLNALLEGDPSSIGAAVLRSVEIKAQVVSDDEREAGPREILNFGHTLGHALEAQAGYRVPHGTAVAVGMILEARLGEVLGVTAPGTSERLERLMACLELSLAPPGPEGTQEVLAYLRSDKKTRRGRARFVLLKALGRVARGERWSHEVEETAVAGVLERWSAGT